MTLASTVVGSRVFKWSNIAFQYMRSFTFQPRPSKLSNCLCPNWLNIASKSCMTLASTVVGSRVFK